MKIKQQKNKKKILVFSIATILVVSLCVISYLAFARNGNNALTGLEKNTPANNSDVDANPNKPYPESEKSQTNTDPQAPIIENKETGKSTVSVVTAVSVLDGTVIIRGGVNNIVSVDGECFAQLTSPAGESIRKQTTLLRGASTTDCKTIQIPISEFSSGSWSYTLNYSSKSSEGASSETSFNIK